jgi:hypothetical protein
VDVEHRLELFVGHFLDRGVPGIAGVIDDDVQPTECLHRGADETIRKALVGNAAIYGNSFAAGRIDFFGDRTPRFFVGIVDNDFSAMPRQLECDGAANAAARTGNEGDLVLQILHIEFLRRQ